MLLHHFHLLGDSELIGPSDLPVVKVRQIVEETIEVVKHDVRLLVLRNRLDVFVVLLKHFAVFALNMGQNSQEPIVIGQFAFFFDESNRG